MVLHRLYKSWKEKNKSMKQKRMMSKKAFTFSSNNSVEDEVVLVHKGEYCFIEIYMKLAIYYFPCHDCFYIFYNV